MSAYAKAVRRFRVSYFANAVVEADGSIKCAAASIGVHPNTMSTTLNRAGVSFRDLRKLAAERRKPVQSATAADDARRTA
jgi:hypothetical protein